MEHQSFAICFNKIKGNDSCFSQLILKIFNLELNLVPYNYFNIDNVKRDTEKRK
jgi:hypothetical protein